MCRQSSMFHDVVIELDSQRPYQPVVYLASEIQTLSKRKTAPMMPLSAFTTAAKEREKLLKKEKRAKWVRKIREFVQESKRRWKAKRSL